MVPTLYTRFPPVLQTPDHHDRPQAPYCCLTIVLHDASGHQGSNCTFSVLLDSAYSVDMMRDVNHHYNYCFNQVSSFKGISQQRGLHQFQVLLILQVPSTAIKCIYKYKYQYRYMVTLYSGQFNICSSILVLELSIRIFKSCNVH